MVFKFFGKLHGKIKDSNDMLGFLIFHMNEKKDVPASVILDKSGLENPTCYHLLKSLEASHYIIYTFDTMTVLSLGENNYRSPLKRFLMWFLKAVLFTSKTLLSYVAGIVSVIVAEIVILYITTPESVEEFLRNILLLLQDRL